MEANYGSAAITICVCNTVDQLQGTYASSSSGNGQLPGLQLFAVDALTIPRCGAFVSAATVFLIYLSFYFVPFFNWFYLVAVIYRLVINAVHRK